MSLSPFQNQRVALGYAGAVILGVAIFAGSLSAPNNVDKGASEQQVSEDNATDEKRVARNEQPVIADFAPDEELIDDTKGFDPTPDSSLQTNDTIENTQARSSKRSTNGDRDNPVPIQEIANVQEIKE